LKTSAKADVATAARVTRGQFFKAKFAPMPGAAAYAANLRLRNSNAYALVGAWAQNWRLRESSCLRKFKKLASDEFVKKSPKMKPKSFFVKINKKFPRIKEAQIFELLFHHSTRRKQSPNLVTLVTT
jgi:hypothetical protein